MGAKSLRLLACLCILMLSACSLHRGQAPEVKKEKPVLVGVVERAAVEEVVPDWVEAEVSSDIEPEAAGALLDVPPGAEVQVFFGTWCGDSRRELARLWRALDEVGGEVPFPIRFIAVDRAKAEPAAEIAGIDLRYVPTFVVRRGGQEVGRIIETSPHGIERDLLDLLTGKIRGVLSASRPELATAGGAEPPDGN